MAQIGQAPVKKISKNLGLFNKLLHLILLFFFIGGAGYWVYSDNLKPVDSPDEGKVIKVTVPKGASTAKIAQVLEEKGVIKNGLVLRLYARVKGLDGELKAGKYSIKTGLSVPEILDKLAQGSNEYFSFTIPEGFNIEQIVERLVNENLIDKKVFMDLVANGEFDYEFLEGLPHNEKRLEGYLFPDTYKITRHTTEKQIINMMLARFAKEITPEYRQSVDALGLSLHEVVTLASLIEREAKVDKERPNVAAVFLNRLKKGWKLESCATVQYALGEQKPRLLNKDLEIDSPYNTYKIKGLPPGPIGSPGTVSLLAAVNPANVNYLFFVVSKDGQHVFSNTLREHNLAKAQYIDNNFN